MSAVELIRDVARAGGWLIPEGDDLVLEAAAPLPDDLLRELRQHKPEVLAALREREGVYQHGMPLTELQQEAGEDREWLKDDPPALLAFARAVTATRMRERGEVPTHYTRVTTCKHCGPVPIFEGCPPIVEGCPWCFNRLAGLPVPRIEKAAHERARSALNTGDL